MLAGGLCFEAGGGTGAERRDDQMTGSASIHRVGNAVVMG
jgi:hypothetical protein